MKLDIRNMKSFVILTFFLFSHSSESYEINNEDYEESANYVNNLDKSMLNNLLDRRATEPELFENIDVTIQSLFYAVDYQDKVKRISREISKSDWEQIFRVNSDEMNKLVTLTEEISTYIIEHDGEIDEKIINKSQKLSEQIFNSLTKDYEETLELDADWTKMHMEVEDILADEEIVIHISYLASIIHPLYTIESSYVFKSNRTATDVLLSIADNYDYISLLENGELDSIPSVLPNTPISTIVKAFRNKILSIIEDEKEILSTYRPLLIEDLRRLEERIDELIGLREYSLIDRALAWDIVKRTKMRFENLISSLKDTLKDTNVHFEQNE